MFIYHPQLKFKRVYKKHLTDNVRVWPDPSSVKSKKETKTKDDISDFSLNNINIKLVKSINMLYGQFFYYYYFYLDVFIMLFNRVYIVVWTTPKHLK